MDLTESVKMLVDAILGDAVCPSRVGELAQAVLTALVSDLNEQNVAQVTSILSRELVCSPAGLASLRRLPRDLANVVLDMCMQLEDTLEAPEIAKNFESTPTQLLSRLRQWAQKGDGGQKRG